MHGLVGQHQYVDRTPRERVNKDMTNESVSVACSNVRL